MVAKRGCAQATDDFGKRSLQTIPLQNAKDVEDAVELAERIPRLLRHVPEPVTEREFFIDDLLVRIHFTIVMIRWTGLAPNLPHTALSRSRT